MATFGQKLDPQEELDWTLNLSSLLEADEEIDSYELVLLPEAVALGLTLMSGGGRDHALTPGNRGISFWTEIDDAFKNDPAFDGGVLLPMEVTIVTNSNPTRTRNRTFRFPVAQLGD